MSAAATNSFRLAVLNPQGRDPDQQFVDGPGDPKSPGHAPVNYHAYAACTHGGFYRNTKTVLALGVPTLVLLRRDLAPAIRAIRKLKKAGIPVAISFKEAGAHQVAETLNTPARVKQFRQACELANLCLASTPDLVTTYRHASPEAKVEFIPTPYPVDVPEWDVSIPNNERRGLLVGTREFDVPTRNHMAALFCAAGISRQTRSRVTVINLDGRTGYRHIIAAGIPPDRLTILDGKRSYADYLTLIASHRIVFQLDRSAVPGQVAGDSLLCRIPCIGGDGATERLAFNPLNGFGRTNEELVDIACRLLTDETAYAGAVEQSQASALAKLSFQNVAKHLEAFFSTTGTRN